jgi:heme-degrading monooxygenase HmoA
MIYEMRTYEAMPGRIRDIVARFANTTDRLFRKYGFRPVGYWIESIGDNTLLHYMLAWENDAERLAKWEEFRKDPERIEAFAKSEENGPLVARINNRIWVGTAFSEIR